MGESIHMKGHPINHGNSTSARARKYSLMLLFAFAAAVAGVMVLHMFRERRIFSILLRDKDAQIITLQILLKKERDHAKEVKLKTEEIKLKINILRSQKAGLDAKLLEMHSLLSSIKEERKVMESLIDEKQSEINLLRRQQQQQPAKSDQITAQALDKNNVTSISMDLTSLDEEYPPPINVSDESDPSNSVNSTTMSGQYELGGSELEKVESIDSTIESQESDHHDDSIQGSATSLDVREELNNQAQETKGGGDPEEIAATKLDSANANTATTTSKSGGSRHGRNRRSGHSKEKRWKMLVKSRRSQAGRNRDKDQVKLSSTGTVAEEVELLRRDGNGVDESTGADIGEEQSLVSNGEQATSDERDAGSEHYQHDPEVTVMEDEENKPDEVVESVIEEIKEGEKDHEEAKQEEGTGGHDDQQQQQPHEEEEEEEQLEF